MMIRWGTILPTAYRVTVTVVRASLPNKEDAHIEFKERLIPSVHLRDDKRQHLASQMRDRLLQGGGKAVYVVGVDDDGHIVGLSDLELEETLTVLRTVAVENNSSLERVEKFQESGRVIAKVVIAAYSRPVKSHVTVSVAGHVNHGKSTLIACLMTKKKDDGKAWLYLDTLPHEIERNLSADIHHALLGFNGGEAITTVNPLDREERHRVFERSEKVVSFVDTVGHEPWLRTTIRGLLGQEIDYGFLVVAADDGLTYVSREHLGIMLAMGLPVLVCVTKADRVTEQRLNEAEREVTTLLKSIGRVPYSIRSQEDISVVLDKLSVVSPIFRTSAATRQGFDLLYVMLHSLPQRIKPMERSFLMYIDRVYNVEGVGSVVSGAIKQGRLLAGSELIVGPDVRGDFKPVRAKTIEMHYARLSEAEAGLIVGIAVRGVKHEELGRGMVLCDPRLSPVSVKRFEADIVVLSHPTRVTNGYEPVLHINTVSSTVKFRLLDRDYLKAGENGHVEMTFRYRPWFVNESDKFVFREGKCKGIGTVTKIVEYA